MIDEDNKKEYYSVRVVPLVRPIEFPNSKGCVLTENLTSKEIHEMSCDPRMLWVYEDAVYFAEMPLTYRGKNVSSNLFYIFDELTPEEQEKYADRTMVIDVTRPKVVNIYSTDNDKKVETKEKVKTKKRTKKKEDKK